MQRVEQSRSRWPVVVGALALAGVLLWWFRGGEGEGAAVAEADVNADQAGQGGQAGAYTGPRGRPTLVIDPLRGERASITGTVTDKGGAPIAGAQVCARAQTEKLGSSDTRKAHCSTSEGDGHYRIGDLFGVRHSVVASAPSYISDRYHRGTGAASRDYVELRPGQETSGIDIKLEGGGVEIRGTVKDLSGGPIEGAQVSSDAALAFTGADGGFSAWVRPGAAWVSADAEGYAPGWEEGAVPGHVFEVFLTPESVLVGKVVRIGDGSPVEGARVTAESGGDGWNQASAISDAGGNFRLDGLKPGPYKARAESDDALGLADEQAILGLGETSEQIIIKAHPAFFVEGTITIEGGGVCEDGWLNLQDKANARGGHGTDEPDGTKRVRGLLPGDYEVSAHCQGHVSEEKYPHAIVVDKSLSGLKWVVTKGQAIRGVVVDSAGKPVPRVNIYASAKPDPSQPRAHQTSSWGGDTDEKGAFELAGLLPGAYMLNVSVWQPPRATPPKPLEVTLPKGQDVDSVRIELPATGEVRGTVRDQRGNPIGKTDVSMYDGVHWQSASADDEGNFKFEFVAAGEYRVVARRGWGDEMRAPGTTDDDVQGEKVTVKAGGVEVVKLVVEGRSGKITGVVRDADGGPVVDAFIEATRESDSAASAAGGAMREGRWGSFWGTPHLTDPDGRFTLDELPDGKHTLRAHRKGGGEAIAEHVEVGGDVVLTIAEAGRMSGTVSSRGGDAPEEFTISVSDETTGFGRTDHFFRTRGVWSLAELPAGKYKVRVSAGSGAAEAEATMESGKDTTGVKVELAPRVTVRGKVVGLDDQPVPGLRVSVSAQGGGVWFGGGGDEDKLNITDEAGRYEVEQAPTGKVQIAVVPRSWQDSDYDWTMVPTVIDGSGTTVEVPPIRVIKKRVKDEEASGDLGYTLKQDEPGADPMLRKLVVAVIRPGGPAAASSLKAGDEIVSVDGQDVTGPNAYVHRQLTNVLPGTVVTLGLAAGGSVQLTAGKRP